MFVCHVERSAPDEPELLAGRAEDRDRVPSAACARRPRDASLGRMKSDKAGSTVSLCLTNPHVGSLGAGNEVG